MSESVFVDAVHTNDFADSADVPNPPSPPAVYYLPPAGGKMSKLPRESSFQMARPEQPRRRLNFRLFL